MLRVQERQNKTKVGLKHLEEKYNLDIRQSQNKTKVGLKHSDTSEVPLNYFQSE